MKVVIVTLKSWNIKNTQKLQQLYNDNIKIYLITEKEQLNISYLEDINPKYIFFPHWSWEIPKNIYEKYNCIVFHMTDLPFGRGGSPLQNLISRGIENTKISAIKVEKNFDAGPIYLKKDLNLNGTAEEIFIRASGIIFREMIPEIISNEIVPKNQIGKAIVFERRTPKQSQINSELSIEQIYDYIRMLDCDGYPNAFIKFGPYKLSFSRASKRDGKIVADVEIVEVSDE